MKKQTKQGLRARTQASARHGAWSARNDSPSQKKPIRLGTVLREALETSGLEIPDDLPRLWTHWVDLVGPAIARHTWPEAVKGDLLLVNVSSAPWLQELQYLRDEMVERLNKGLQKEVIRQIRFQIGPVGPH